MAWETGRLGPLTALIECVCAIFCTAHSQAIHLCCVVVVVVVVVVFVFVLSIQKSDFSSASIPVNVFTGKNGLLP